jgi:hypothetical protein
MREGERNLRVYILPGRRSPDVPPELYDAAYQTWSAVWHETFGKLRGIEKVDSDNFTRQDEWICIFDGGTCAVAAALRCVDASDPTVFDDSYFRPWPDGSLPFLSKRGRRLIIWSQIGANKDYRGRALGPRTLDLIMALCIRRGRDLKADAMTGNMRVGRAVARVGLDMGAVELGRGTDNTVPVCFAVFFPEALHDGGRQDGTELVDELWSSRINLCRHAESYW